METHQQRSNRKCGNTSRLYLTPQSLPRYVNWSSYERRSQAGTSRTFHYDADEMSPIPEGAAERASMFVDSFVNLPSTPRKHLVYLLVTLLVFPDLTRSMLTTRMIPTCLRSTAPLRSPSGPVPESTRCMLPMVRMHMAVKI